jgi:hypothetical protein
MIDSGMYCCLSGIEWNGIRQHAQGDYAALAIRREECAILK